MSNRPEMRYHGVTQAVMETPPAQTPTTKSAHILLSHILAARGTDTPIFTDATGFINAYGLETLNDHRHDVHQLKYVMAQLQGNGHAVVKRIILPGAKKAMLRVSVELIPAMIPIYKLDENWRPMHQYDPDTGAYNRIPLGYRKAYRAVLHASVKPYPDQYQAFGLGAMSNYRKGDALGYNARPLQGTIANGDKIEQSIIYPIMDLELADYGEFGNDVTVAITPFVEANSLHTSAVSLLTIRELNTPMMNRDGISETTFGLTPVSDSDVALARALQLNFSGGYNGLIGRVHTYTDYIKMVTDLLVNGSVGVAGEIALINEAIALNTHAALSYPLQSQLNDNASSKFLFNILTGRSNTGAYHVNGDFRMSEVYGGVEFNDGEMHGFTGGSDGYPYTESGELDKLQLLRMYDEAVRAEMLTMKVEGNAYHNMARFPYTVWYDSGYTMETKLAAFSILKWRPEVTVIQSGYSVAEYGAVIPEPEVPEPEVPTISCVGATNGTGCIQLNGLWDVYVDEVKGADGVDAAAIAAFLNGTGKFNVVECTETPPPIQISCAGATDSVEYGIVVRADTGLDDAALFAKFQTIIPKMSVKVNGAVIDNSADPDLIGQDVVPSAIAIVAPQDYRTLSQLIGLKLTNVSDANQRILMDISHADNTDGNGNPFIKLVLLSNSNPTWSSTGTVMSGCVSPEGSVADGSDDGTPGGDGGVGDGGEDGGNVDVGGGDTGTGGGTGGGGGDWSDHVVDSSGSTNTVSVPESNIIMDLYLDGVFIIKGKIVDFKQHFATGNGNFPQFREVGDTNVFKLVNVSTTDYRIILRSEEDMSHLVVGSNSAVEYVAATNTIYIYLKGSTVTDVPDIGQIGGGDVNDVSWNRLTFSTPAGVRNPTYDVSVSQLGTVRVSTGAVFVGQSVAPLNEAMTIVGKPSTTQPLTLNLAHEYGANITNDEANPTSPVLSGTTRFQSPISVLFSKDVHAVSVDGGHFNAAQSTHLEFFDRQGRTIANAKNVGEGIETFGYSFGGEAIIAGFSFYINENEQGGFAIDNLRFK